MAEFNFSARIERLLQKISGEQVDAILIRKPENLFYFSGFNGDSSCLFISKKFSQAHHGRTLQRTGGDAGKKF